MCVHVCVRALLSFYSPSLSEYIYQIEFDKRSLFMRNTLELNLQGITEYYHTH